MNPLQKLELTWIGKGNEPKLEPRILIEDPSKSYGDSNTENIVTSRTINILTAESLSFICWQCCGIRFGDTEMDSSSSEFKL